jgi:hypothetical protein
MLVNDGLLPNSTVSVAVRHVMKSNAVERHDPADLGELERSIRRLVWQHDVVAAEQVGRDLEPPLKDSTIHTVLRRPEEKGYVEPNSSFREAKEPFASPVSSSSSGS